MCSFFSVTLNPEEGAAWRAAILKDVPLLPNTGAVPGTLTVLGEDARPVLLSEKGAILLAVGELGAGRVAVFPHDEFINKEKEKGYDKLRENLCAWLTKSEGEAPMLSSAKTLNVTTRTSDLEDGMLLKFSMSKSQPTISTGAILDHILSGGSLLHCICPWSWLQINKGKKLKDMPLYTILAAAGIYYNDERGRIPPTGLDIAKFKAADAHHSLVKLNRVAIK